MKHKGVDWDNADWSKSNRELAEEYGVVRRTVDKARRRRGLPNPKFRHGQGNPNASFKVRMKRMPIDDPDYEFAMCSSGKDKRRKPSCSWKKAVHRFYGDRCAICGYYNPPVKNHSHHIIPMSKGGKNTIRNGVILCSRCHDEIHANLMCFIPFFGAIDHLI